MATVDPGIQRAAGLPIRRPLPVSYLGKTDMPIDVPASAQFGKLSATQIRNLIAQIGYDQSFWNYKFIGAKNRLGRYQFSPKTLENFGLLLPGVNKEYGDDCVNFVHCWSPTTVTNALNSFANFRYEVIGVTQFLSSKTAQDHLAYQIIINLYNALTRNGSIKNSDEADVAAGMIYVGWALGVGSSASQGATIGGGAYNFRFYGEGDGTNAFNTGRYAVQVLSA